MKDTLEADINKGKTYLGIEFGSTRIKSVLIDSHHNIIASGSHDWENCIIDDVWTYNLSDVWIGLRDCYSKLQEEVYKLYGMTVSKIGAIGISAMMHGYLVFDDKGKQLAPFRTWRNTMTEEAAGLLTKRLKFNIPQRWSIAHLYHSMLNKEPHVKDIGFMTTLAGYVHWRLTGEKTLGIGDAAGMFPVDETLNNYNPWMLNEFNEIILSMGYRWKLESILPRVQVAGEKAGTLTFEGVKLFGTTTSLQVGIPFCPPEGDAGTGMTATNSVKRCTGNVSAGTSIFAMVVLEKKLSKAYTEVDMVATPTGKPVAMVHCNNCMGDVDAWIRFFNEIIELIGTKIEKNELYIALYNKALEGDIDCGGLLSYNYYSGEPITGLKKGCPLFVRNAVSRFTLANFMRMLLFGTLATLKLGMDILTEKEKVCIKELLGHGGLFKVKGVGQRLMAAALNAPVTVMESAGEGGAWGIALLAAYMAYTHTKEDGANKTLECYLEQNVFVDIKGVRMFPNANDARGFAEFMNRYTNGLVVEKSAVENFIYA
ncbi:MAG: hypothetical protein LE178_03650 [Endomicrobium sp.]|nr:hypothetical protein [Endomicrobium sp.]